VPASYHTVGPELKQRSNEITGDQAAGGDDWIKRSGARAQLYAAGYKKEDFVKPIITVAAPCVVHECERKREATRK
jgi:dihydroxy-acid dehydratase